MMWRASVTRCSFGKQEVASGTAGKLPNAATQSACNASHKLVGCCSVVGATTLTELARRVAKGADADALASLLPALRETMRVITTLLRDEERW
jgi:hypothetical protein